MAALFGSPSLLFVLPGHEFFFPLYSIISSCLLPDRFSSIFAYFFVNKHPFSKSVFFLIPGQVGHVDIFLFTSNKWGAEADKDGLDISQWVFFGRAREDLSFFEKKDPLAIFLFSHKGRLHMLVKEQGVLVRAAVSIAVHLTAAIIPDFR